MPQVSVEATNFSCHSVPLNAEGNVTIGDFTTDIDVNSDFEDAVSTARETQNLAFLGRFEAWRGNLGLIFDSAYVNIEQNNTVSRDVQDCCKNIFSSEIDTEITVHYG